MLTTCNGQIDSFVYQDGINSDVCYWLGTTTSNLTGAYAKCVSEGGYPALVADVSMDNAVDAFLTSKGLGSTEVYIGYDVDTTVTNYRLRTLSGQLQSYENFFSYNMNSATWHCVSMYSSAWFAEKCNEDYHFLCSNLSNILAPPTTTTPQTTTEYSSTTESTTYPSTSSPSSSSESTSTTTSPPTSSQSPSTTTFSSLSSQSTSTTTTSSTSSHSTSATTSPSTSSQSTSTTTSPSTTGTTTPSQGCACPTNCVPVSNTVTINSTEELNAKIAELKKEIEVEKSTLSSNIRKKTSADDPRPSAKTFGFIGVIIISVVLGGIVALDIPRLVIGLKGLKTNVFKFCKKFKK
nr:cell wall integrity and stress response component 2-like isoform X2 [Crassostrea gigas]XP_034338774.1 cell wall integrity and stress response component 2-like isoform X2 [Crassostrea gigas]